MSQVDLETSLQENDPMAKVQHFVVTPTGLTLKLISAASAQDYAATIDGAVIATDDPATGLKNVPMPLLIALYNKVRPEKPVKRFADRETAEKRMVGVLETLARTAPAVPPEELAEKMEAINTAEGNTVPAADDSDSASRTTDDTTTQTEDSTMATATKTARKRSTTKTTATAKRANAAPEITEATVNRVIKMRADGKGWPEILEALDKPASFVLRVRPLMKAQDKSSVKKMGPGSPNYGKGGAKKGKK